MPEARVPGSRLIFDTTVLSNFAAVGQVAGEAACLALAIAQGLVLASDDLAARREASRRGVRLTGTVGILVRAVREQHLGLADANQVLAQMIALRYRAPVQRLDDLV